MLLQYRFHRLLNWEYWSVYAIYLPLLPVWLYLACRAKTLLFFHGANPAIKYGGMVMESKKEIYDLIPEEFIPKTLLVKTESSIIEILKLMKSKNIDFPFIVKPDIGLKGLGVEKISTLGELEDYKNKSDFDFLVQEEIKFQNEVGIFYHRLPTDKKGKISGMVQKEFLKVKGDGKKNLRELILENPRSAMQMKAILRKFQGKMNEVIEKDLEFILIPFGSHTRGAKFIDISSDISPKLVEKIDAVCNKISGFYFGRLDVMFHNYDELSHGENFKIIEINGSKSEPTHMYDPKHSLLFAWKEISRHWKIMSEISRENHKNGTPYLNIKEGFSVLKQNLIIEKKLRKISFVD